MHDVARTSAKDRMKLVLARGRKTNVPAILEAREPVAKIPAPGPLANIARQRSGVANLWRPNFFGGFREYRILFANALIAAQRVQRDQPANLLDAAALRLNLVQPSDGLEI